MAPRFDTAPFHVATGPEALFARVRHVLREPAGLTARGPYVTERLERQGAPVEALLAFDPAYWEPVLAEVRTDTGKWVKATWRVRVAGQDWWAVIGFHSASASRNSLASGTLSILRHLSLTASGASTRRDDMNAIPAAEAADLMLDQR